MNDLKQKFDIVCLVTNDLSTDRRMIRTCNTLTTNGWKVLLMGRRLEDSEGLPTYSFDTHRVSCFFNSGPLFYIEILWRFRKVLKQLNYKKLLCTDLDTIGVLCLINTAAIEVFFDSHEYFTEVPELNNAPLKKRIWTAWGKRAMQKVNVAYTVGPELSRILGAKYSFPFEVIRNVPETAPREPKVGQENGLLSLIYLGVLNPGRGLEVLIDIVIEKDSLELTIVGDGPLEMRLKTKANNNSRIHFLGKVAPTQLVLILSKADIGVNLLEKSSQSYYYSLANKFFDYIHAGLPVLCMNYPEYKNISNQFDCIYPVDELSTKTILATIERIDINGREWQIKRQQAILASETYNWENERKNLLEILGCK